MIENARWADADKTGITCTLDGVPGAFIPAGHYLLDGFEGEIADYVAPEEAPLPVPDYVEDWQFSGQAAAEGLISDEQGLAWTARGETPRILLDAVSEVLSDDPKRLNRVKYFLAGSKTYPRYHELTPLIGAVLGKDTAEKLDAFWIAAKAR